MEALIEQHLDNPVILAALLFLATFVLEEAAIVLAAALAASGVLATPAALLAVGSGVIVSDWLLYALGALAGTSPRIRGWVPERQLRQGRALLGRSLLAAGLLARLVPWLLFPVFVASGFLRVGFRRFALINGGVAVAYVLALFFGAVEVYQLLLAWLGPWAWLCGAALVLAMLWGGRRAARRYFPSDKAEAPGD